MVTPIATVDPETRAEPAAEPDSRGTSDWLLVGKLAPPEQRITVASREALLARLDASLTRSLSVVVSPPGYGKTTLMTQWWRTLRLRQDLHACWLTLDDIDSEVSRFMAGVILSGAAVSAVVGEYVVGIVI